MLKKKKIYIYIYTFSYNVSRDCNGTSVRLGVFHPIFRVGKTLAAQEWGKFGLEWVGDTLSSLMT